MPPVKRAADAHKAAMNLLTARAKLVEDLAVAAEDKTTAETAIGDATTQGAALVAEAHRQAAQLVKTARHTAATRTAEYAKRYRAARTAGWLPAELTKMSYTPPRGRRTPTTETPHEPAGNGATDDQPSTINTPPGAAG